MPCRTTPKLERRIHQKGASERHASRRRIPPRSQNRHARHDYDILEVFEAGLELRGGEVKLLRAGQVSLQAGARPRRGR